MDIESNTQTVFVPISASFASKMYSGAVIMEGSFTENIASKNQVVLTLSQKHILARSSGELSQ